MQYISECDPLSQQTDWLKDSRTIICLFSAKHVIYSGGNLNQKHVDIKKQTNKQTAGKQDSYLEPLFQDFKEI